MSTLTRRHFKAIAAALSLVRPVPERYAHMNSYDAAVVQWRDSVCRLADMCAAENERFDRHKFYEACGYYASYDEAAAKCA